MASDTLTFFRAWLGAPLRVASIVPSRPVPSGAALARLITSEVGATTGPVLELGPGTGVFTAALIARGVRPDQLTLVELGDEFANMLALRYPAAAILRGDAAAITITGRVHGAAVSGLPLLSMAPEKVRAVLSNAFAVLEEDGALYQFTYGLRCPVRQSILRRLGLRSEIVGTTFNNLPPATVYRITRIR